MNLTRSLINKSIVEAITFFDKHRFPLPSYAYWIEEDWIKSRENCQEIVDNGLGWDVTDFGSGEFLKVGRIIFTLRNGNIRKSQLYPKTFAQKAMYLKDGQKSPVHFHRQKMEDICNQGGGITLIRLWKNDHGQPDKASLTYSFGGILKTTKGGEIIELQPGDSITIPPQTFHEYWAKNGVGPVLSIEVSSVNDDQQDNFWLGKNTRFSKIREDEDRKYLLVNEYATVLT